MKKNLVSLFVAASVVSAFTPVMAEQKSQGLTVTTSSPDNAYLYCAVLRPGARVKYRFINNRHEFKSPSPAKVEQVSLDIVMDSNKGARQALGLRQLPKPATSPTPVQAAPDPVEAEPVETMTSEPAEVVEQSPIFAALGDF